ncbi:hypothetical protein HY411_02705 [Candidatus Gottesmanbacteria bacterium]|nr:hypothetical protein [Candidatus Gottesmanbacteria bacterium]
MHEEQDEKPDDAVVFQIARVNWDAVEEETGVPRMDVAGAWAPHLDKDELKVLTGASTEPELLAET